MKNKGTIRDIVDKELCTGCGTCIAICPKGAINLIINERIGIYVPKINEEKCNKCGICIKVCPGYEVNFKQLNLEIFGKEPKDTLIGNYLKCYLGHTSNYHIRINSASGGLVTQLLIFSLEKEIIDGALVTRMKKDNRLEPEPFIARTKEEIIEASKSKYCPVPANIALKEILNSKEGKKFSVVGLPCHIHGIRKAEMVNKKLREKIVLHLGIFCSHTDSFRSTKFLLHKLGIEKGQIKKITYRGEGWPGKIKIDLINGEERYIPHLSPISLFMHSFFFTPFRCLLCNDLTSELSDISFGDAWLPEIMAKEHEGKSIVISRSKKGEELLNLAKSERYIELTPIDLEKVIQSQRTFLHFKKMNLKERIKLRRFFGKKSPKISMHKKKISTYNKFVALLSLIYSHLGSKFYFLLKHIPFKILRMYSSTLNFLYSSVIEDDFSNLIRDKKGLNILILHAHWNNRGDEAAIRAMINSLRSKLSIKNMKIMISSKNLTYFPYRDIELMDLFPSRESKGKISSILSFGMDIFLTLITFGKLAFTNQGKKFLSAVYNADVVIHAPGGPSIGDLYAGKYGLGEICYLYRLLIPILNGKPVFFYAPSMGPFSGKLLNLLRKFILKRASAIILREQVSSKYLKEHLGLDSYVTLDSSFQNDINKDNLNRYSNIFKILNIIENEKVVGMTITDLKWHPIYKNNIELRKKIITSLLEINKYLINKGYVILLIPQIYGEEEKEIHLLEYIRRLNEDKIFILPLNIDSYAQQVIISKLFCVIGMRYHPNIFASKGNVPSIAISYEHKTDGFMEKLERKDLLINVEDINKYKIIDKFKYLEKNYNTIKEQIKNRSPQLKEESKKTTDIIIKKLKKLEIIKNSRE